MAAVLFLLAFATLLRPASSVFNLCTRVGGSNASCFPSSCPAGTQPLPSQVLGSTPFTICQNTFMCCQDIDECAAGNHTCNINANCINRIPGYVCECKDGFVGDGFVCNGPQSCSNHDICGTVIPEARFAFTEDSTLRRAPWQASLRTVNRLDITNKTLANSVHQGGAVIIQDRWLLTDCLVAISAGMVLPGDSFSQTMFVVAGDYNLFQPEYWFGQPKEQIRTVKNVYQHPGFPYPAGTYLSQIFANATAENDFAVIKENNLCLVELEDPLLFNEFVRPVCLPTRNVCNEDTGCSATGWGTDEDRSRKGILQWTDLEPYPRETCAELEYYRTNGSEPANIFPENTSCAMNSRGSFTCLGDYGGPFVCNSTETTRKTLHGILTFRSGVCHNNVMLTDVAPNVDWIWQTCSSAP